MSAVVVITIWMSRFDESPGANSIKHELAGRPNQLLSAMKFQNSKKTLNRDLNLSNSSRKRLNNASPSVS